MVREISLREAGCQEMLVSHRLPMLEIAKVLSVCILHAKSEKARMPLLYDSSLASNALNGVSKVIFAGE